MSTLKLCWVPALMLAMHCKADQPPPVSQTQSVSVLAGVLENSSARSPWVIRSEEDASAFFAGEDLDRLRREVDFSRQQVLLFAWRGSGQDSLQALAPPSPSGTVVFAFSQGRTRDVRPHHKVFVLRSDLAWRVR